MMNATDIDFTIVIPVYFNGDCLTALTTNLIADVFEKKSNLTGEIIFVDDGSKDNSLDVLLELKSLYPDKIKILKLTRNFGQVNAVTAGFSIASGKCVLTISADGQEPTHVVNDMLDAFFQEQYEVVICNRLERDESYYRKITSKFFYSIVRKFIFHNMPYGGFDIFLLSQRALSIYLKNLDAHPFVQGQVLWMGFNFKVIQYRRLARIAGKSRWTLGKKITYLIDGILAYSYLPIRVMSVAGLLISLIGFLYGLLIIFSYFYWGHPIKGWSPIVILILFIGGFQTLMLGIIGEYLWRTLAQVRKRDHYIIENQY